MPPLPDGPVQAALVGSTELADVAGVALLPLLPLLLLLLLVYLLLLLLLLLLLQGPLLLVQVGPNGRGQASPAFPIFFSCHGQVSNKDLTGPLLDHDAQE